MSMQSLKKIGQKVLKLEHGNEALTDGQMDGQTDGRSKFEGYNITPPLFVWRGIKTINSFISLFSIYQWNTGFNITNIPPEIIPLRSKTNYILL